MIIKAIQAVCQTILDEKRWPEQWTQALVIRLLFWSEIYLAVNLYLSKC